MVDPSTIATLVVGPISIVDISSLFIVHGIEFKTYTDLPLLKIKWKLRIQFALLHTYG